MDTAFMRKTFALIAKGLIEKEQLLQTKPTRYPYSKAMQHGINMFLAASQWAGSQAAVEYPDEVSFLAHFITRPVEEWFDTWESGAVEQLHLQEEPFYAYDAFAYQKAGNVYVPSSDCYEFLETQDSDIMNGTDERILYIATVGTNLPETLTSMFYPIENTKEAYKLTEVSMEM